jgi:hypothetical protein
MMIGNTALIISNKHQLGRQGLEVKEKFLEGWDNEAGGTENRSVHYST